MVLRGPRTPVGPAALAVASFLVVLAAACDEPQANRGRVEGVVRASPSCPVAQQGQVCPPLAVSGEVQAVQDGQVKVTARTNPTGQYQLALPAGNYTLQVDVGGPLPACPLTPIQVRAAATAAVDIDCDTGIR